MCHILGKVKVLTFQLRAAVHTVDIQCLQPQQEELQLHTATNTGQTQVFLNILVWLVYEQVVRQTVLTYFPLFILHIKF